MPDTSAKGGTFSKGDKRLVKPMSQEHKDKLKESALAYHNSLTEQDKKVKFKVNGQSVTYKNWKIFEIYATTGNGSPKTTAEISGVSIAQVRRLREQDWWGQLTAEHIDSRQDWLFRELADNINTLSKAVVSIWDGTIQDPKLASAVVKSLETFNKMGKRHGKAFTEPLTKSSQDIYLEDHSVHNTQVNNINMAQVFPKMTGEEQCLYAKDGVIPARFIELNEAEETDEEL